MRAVCSAVIACSVALRKERVDRNATGLSTKSISNMSLSARRAWIEMLDKTHRREPFQSLSARRAWIEIGAHRWAP